jgi:hypothetical protein
MGGREVVRMEDGLRMEGGLEIGCEDERWVGGCEDGRRVGDRM